jgi:uncharacterized protein (UPF0332 family)
MITENIRALVTYWLEQADESLEAARTLLEKRLIKPSVNRAYYAMFTVPSKKIKLSGSISKRSKVMSSLTVFSLIRQTK